MSSASASKPDKFSVGSCASYYVRFDDIEMRGSGRVSGRRHAQRDSSGNPTWTLQIAPFDRSEKVFLHESWCKPIPDPQAVPGDFPPQDLIEVEDQVIAEIWQRRDAGRKKYGTTMERTDLSVTDWIQHAKEEALDFAIYLEKLKREVGKSREFVELNGSETLTTFGGEGAERDGTWDEYGLDLGQVSVHGVTPAQAIRLACTLVDHLVRNGHDFELRKGTHQDQRIALICTR
jgi:hypothetical protein